MRTDGTGLQFFECRDSSETRDGDGERDSEGCENVEEGRGRDSMRLAEPLDVGGCRRQTALFSVLVLRNLLDEAMMG